MPDIIKVLLVDDHPLVRQGIKKILEQETDREVISEAGSYDEALNILSDCNPHICIIDISLDNEKDGIDLVKKIQRTYPEIKTMGLSMHDESTYIERAVKAGARGYVDKKDPSTVIINAVRAVLQGDIYLSSSVSGKVLRKFINYSEKAVKDYNGLIEREHEVFSLIGQGYVTGEITHELDLSTSTVESHRRHIKEKLQLQKSSDLLKTAITYRIQQESNKL
jgi:DNA-binding NarL/FixJ family response regulator